MTIIKYIVVAVISYLLGSLNFSIIVSRKLAKKDIRESGSGNAGATNMLRTYGKKYAVLTMIGDVVKVAAAIIIAFFIFDAPFDMIFGFAERDTSIICALYKAFAGFFCVLGHIFPLYFSFKGGKGVAACTGMVILVDWRVALILFVIFAVTVLISKWISLGSVVIALLFPILIYIFHQSLILTAVSILFTAIVIVAHRENIKRILNGTENKITIKK